MPTGATCQQEAASVLWAKRPVPALALPVTSSELQLNSSDPQVPCNTCSSCANTKPYRMGNGSLNLHVCLQLMFRMRWDLQPSGISKSSVVQRNSCSRRDNGVRVSWKEFSNQAASSVQTGGWLSSSSVETLAQRLGEKWYGPSPVAPKKGMGQKYIRA